MPRLRAIPVLHLLPLVPAMVLWAAGPVPPLSAAATAAKPAAAAVKSSDSSASRAGGVDEARAALRRAVVFHRQAADLSLRFQAEVYNADLDKRDTYKGRLLLKDSTRFRLEVPGGTYVSDGKVFCEYHAKNKQAVIRPAGEMQGDLPANVLLRFLDADPLSVARVKEAGKEYLELVLDPSRVMKSLDSLSVRLDRKDHSLRRVDSRDANGNEARYTLLSVKRNAGVGDKEFTFAPPKGTDVVDMR